MNSIWYSLAWKEWHEHKWKLASMVSILWGAAALVFLFIKPDDLLAVAIGIVGLCMLPLSMFIGLGAAAGERSRNTLPFLESLPTPLWRVAIVKIVMGLFSLFAAIALSIALLMVVWEYIAWQTGHNTGRAIRQLDLNSLTGRPYLDFFIILAPLAASVFLWSAAAGVNRRDEVSAGARAVIFVVGWSIVLALCFALANWIVDFSIPANRDKWAWLGVLAFATLPGGTFPAGTISLDLKPPIPLTLTFVTAAVTNCLLLAVYVLRFGKFRQAEVRSRRAAERQSARGEWLSAPRFSPATALSWKQVRESGPVAIAGIAVCAGVTLVTVLVALIDRRQPIPEAIGEAYPFMAIFFGTLVALVAGIGVCLNDVNPKINEFWRSRPIQPDLWFWIKFVTGLVVVLASIYLPIAFLAAIKIPVDKGWPSSDATYMPLMIQLAVFAAAVVTTCLVRQAVYAAILSIAVVYLGTLFGIAICISPQWLQLQSVNLLRDPTPPQVAFGLATSFTISTLLAWLAVRYDWGKKSRY
jgi:hypothetical protein